MLARSCSGGLASTPTVVCDEAAVGPRGVSDDGGGRPHSPRTFTHTRVRVVTKGSHFERLYPLQFCMLKYDHINGKMFLLKKTDRTLS